MGYRKVGGRAWTVERNVFGDIISVVDPLGTTTTRTYSPEGRLLGEVLGDKTTRTYGYNREGRLTRTVDEAGNVSTTDYIAYGHATTVTDAAGGVLTQRFSSVFEPVEITNPDGMTWSMHYDRDSRCIAETDYNHAHTTYTLDGLGRAVTTTDALGRTIDRIYDIAGRLTDEIASTDGRTQYRYDIAGDLIEASNADAVIESTRDILGRVTTETTNGRTITTTYDAAGRRTHMRLHPANADTGAEPAPSSQPWTTSYTYDHTGALTALSTAGPHSTPATFAFAYDLTRRETHRTVGHTHMHSAWDNCQDPGLMETDQLFCRAGSGAVCCAQ